MGHESQTSQIFNAVRGFFCIFCAGQPPCLRLVRHNGRSFFFLGAGAGRGFGNGFDSSTGGKVGTGSGVGPSDPVGPGLWIKHLFHLSRSLPIQLRQEPRLCLEILSFPSCDCSLQALALPMIMLSFGLAS